MEDNKLKVDVQHAETEQSQLEYKKARLESFATHEVECYPYFFETTMEFSNFIESYKHLANDEIDKDYIRSLVGRVMEIRKSGKNLWFYSMQSGTDKLQLLVNRKYYESDVDKTGMSLFDVDTSIIKRGDVIGFYGYACRSRTGELSILPKRIVLIAPCLKLLPKQHYGLTDQETRERKRYLDLIINPDNLQILKTRHLVYQSIRTYLNSLDFIEVQTPCLHPIVGGASAKPFITYHNDTKQNMYLRVAPELYLKQLVIGGAQRVYEIGPQFRNESADPSHNPEFTSLEFYMGYTDYNTLFAICEKMICDIVTSVTGSNTIKLKDREGNEKSICFETPFARLDIMSELAKADIVLDLNSPDLLTTLDNICNERGIPCSPPRTVNRLLDKLIGTYVESKCIHPTFVINHPKCMSPLAKACKHDKTLSERFELFVNRMELCNAYSELNDPDEQYEMFAMQQKDKNNGDEESQSVDKTYLDALHYGLPCTAGFGCGLDRLIMLLLGKNTIRDVIAFPTLKNIE